MIDRLFPGVGRVRRASGTTDKRTFRDIDTMLTTFSMQSRHDILEAVRDGKLKPTVALTWFKRNAIDKIPTADVLPLLGDTWDEWVRALGQSPSHKVSLKKTRRALAIGPEDILNDLPERLSVYRLTAPPYSANQARVHVQAFLRDRLGRSHRLWVAVKYMAPATKPKVPARPILSVDEVRRLVVQLGEKAGAAAWSLAAMGMIPKEYWQDGFEELPDRIRIHGAKRSGRERDVMRWTRVVPPPLGFSTFRKKLSVVSGKRVRPTDFRRCFARWIEEAGIFEMNQRAYMGHGARNMSQLYKLGEVSGQIEADAAKLRAYANEPDLIPTLKVSVSA